MDYNSFNNFFNITDNFQPEATEYKKRASRRLLEIRGFVGVDVRRFRNYFHGIKLFQFVFGFHFYIFIKRYTFIGGFPLIGVHS